jgi:predicted N-acetyltransferase YhbS
LLCGWTTDRRRRIMLYISVTEQDNRDRRSDKMQVEILDRRQLSEAEARPVAELLVKVFPRRSFDERLAKFMNDWRDYSGPEAEFPRSMIIRDGGRVLAHAAATPRTIGTSEGELTVVALARVATDPEVRGRRLGQAVVRAVFDLVDHGPFQHSLFQTSHQVRPFYDKLGAGPVTNRIVNSLTDDPAKNPFWDEVVMRYPVAKHWPEGEIDLRGPGW